MIIVIIYIFLSYVIYDQQLKESFRKSSGPPEKTHYPLFTHLPLKIKKIFPFGQHFKFFRSPGSKGGGHCVSINKIMI